MSPKLLANDIIHEIESIDGLISTDIHQIDFWYQQFRKNIISDNGRPSFRAAHDAEVMNDFHERLRRHLEKRDGLLFALKYLDKKLYNKYKLGEDRRYDKC